jgi:MoaA/NifB/PqqE/SkfB family radical SAM enzyme
MQYYVNLNEVLKEKEIFVIFGSGNVGEKCLSFLQNNGISVSFFVDSNPALKCASRNGKIIFNPQILDELPVEKTFIFVAIDGRENFEEVKGILIQKGYSRQDYLQISSKYINKVNSFKIATKRTLKYVKQYEMNDMPLFRKIEIETINRCNGKCGFCPVNRKSDTRPYAKMTDELFYSIIKQLKELSYTGHIQIFSNNEPLLDDRIFQFTSDVHRELPRAYFTMLTNGLLLSLEKFQELINNLDFMIISNYRTDYEFLPGTKQVYEYCLENPDIAQKVRICKRLENEVLTSRGGIAPNASAVEVFGSVCPHPFSQMVIRPDGKCSLCCNDALGQMTLGDANRQSLAEIWNSEEYAILRNSLLKGSEFIPVCRACDNPVHLIERPDPNDKYINKGNLLNIGMNNSVFYGFSSI